MDAVAQQYSDNQNEEVDITPSAGSIAIIHSFSCLNT